MLYSRLLGLKGARIGLKMQFGVPTALVLRKHGPYFTLLYLRLLSFLGPPQKKKKLSVRTKPKTLYRGRQFTFGNWATAKVPGDLVVAPTVSVTIGYI